MARTITTESVESKTKVIFDYDAYDLFFIVIYAAISFGLRSEVHDSLRGAFMIFSIVIAIFLSSKSSLNKKRKNYESLYLLITRDTASYRPFFAKENR